MNQDDKELPASGRQDGGPSQPPAGAEGVDTSRRRFTRAGLSASVVMTLASRSALANHCSVSAGMSGNQSQPHVEACFGLTPGFWKTHPEEWHASMEPGMCNPITYKNGECKDWWHPTWGQFEAKRKEIEAKDAIRPGFDNLWDDYKAWAGWSDGSGENDPPAPANPPTLLVDCFAGTWLSFTNADQTLMQAFWDPPADINPQTLVAHCGAAMLNSLRFGVDSFGYDPNALIQFINEWPANDPEGLKNALQDLNERGGTS